ncbi:MAG TPA: hypothetical protein VLZ72_03505 [Flavobacterium sp.]|nr:hypothetical protein [Flavobacterium sp.]
MKKILPIFSYLFHPIFIPVYGTVYYFSLLRDFFVKQEIYLYSIQVIILTLLIPLALFYLLQTIGKIDSFMVGNVSQRKIPLAINVFLLLILVQKGISPDRLPGLFHFFVAGLMSNLLALLFVFFKTKVSLHMAGIAAITCFVIGLSIYANIPMIYSIAFMFVLNGFVASSRLYMKAHTVQELFLGMICGALPQIFIWKFWL